MRCWQIQPDHSLKLIEAVTPIPNPDEVRVAVKAVGVNRADLLQVKGLYPPPAGYDERLPGLEYAGVVETVGAAVRSVAVGDAVMGLVPTGAYASQLVVPADETLPIPQGLSFAEAATIPEAFLTAWRALFVEGQLQPGQRCLIRPATSAVGLAAVQLVRAAGGVALGSSRQCDKLATARQFGLDIVVEERADIGEQLLAATAGEGVSLIFDMVGSGWSRLLSGLQQEGKLVLIGVLGGTQTQLDLMPFLMRRHGLKAMTMRSQPKEQRLRLGRLYRQSIAPLFAKLVLKPLPLETFAFASAPKAHEHMQQADFVGKRVLLVEPI